MSILNEATSLKSKLTDLKHRGNKLLNTNPSLEQAVHFNELTRAFISSYIDAPSMESITEPKDQIEVSLEGIGDMIIKLTKYIDKQKEKNNEGKESIRDKQLRIVIDYYSKEDWLNKAHFNTTDITIGGFRQGNYFYRGDKKVTDFLSEVRKDLPEYSSFISKIRAPSSAFIAWAVETIRQLEATPVDVFIDDYPVVVNLLNERLKKQPKSPAEIVKMASHPRLGVPAPDVWAEKYDWDALKPPVMVWVEDEQNAGGRAVVKPLDKAGVLDAVKVLDEIATLLKKLLEDQSAITKFIPLIESCDDFDDEKRDCISEAPANSRLFRYDDLQTIVFSAYNKLYIRLSDLEGAVYSYIKESIITKP
jgi:hypothetical protein